MEKIDLLKFQKHKHKKKKIVGVVLTIIFLIAGTSYLSFLIFYLPKEINLNSSFFQGLSHLMLAKEKDITKEKDVINILVLGMGGLGHEGPYLTDTILLASINKKDKKAAMISIPRDLFVDTKLYGKKKINHINSYAEVDKAGSGPEYTATILEEILDIEINYYVRFDFEGFKKALDIIDGVDIDVPRTFIDPLFPLTKITSESSAQTTTVTFEAGLQHMSGQTALTYARSRHGNNGEGNDFARSKRQQQIILAVKDKILSSETLLSPSKIKKLLGTLKEHLATNISPWEAIQLATLYKDLNIKSENIKINIITSGPQGPLYEDYYEGQYVLLPKKENWSDLQIIAKNPYDTSAKTYTGNYEKTGDVSILIWNGTGIGGLAGSTGLTLQDFGYKIIDIDNSPQKDFEKTVIYTIAGDDKSDALKEIRRILNANISPNTPEWIKDKLKNDKPDFLIITGFQSLEELNK